MMDASELNEQKKLAYNKLKKVCKKQRYEYAKLESRMRNSDITNAYLLEEIKGLRLKVRILGIKNDVSEIQKTRLNGYIDDGDGC